MLDFFIFQLTVVLLHSISQIPSTHFNSIYELLSLFSPQINKALERPQLVFSRTFSGFCCNLLEAILSTEMLQIFHTMLLVWITLIPIQQIWKPSVSILCASVIRQLITFWNVVSWCISCLHFASVSYMEQ